MAVMLTRGANVALAAVAPATSRVVLGLRWDTRVTRGGQLDVDGMALLVGADDRVRTDRHVVFFRNPASPDGSVQHSADLSLSDGDDERLVVELATVPADVEKVVVAAVLDAPTRGAASFGEVRRLAVRLLQGGTREELARYPVRAATSETCLVLAELYRYHGQWKFRAVGQGYHTGITGLAEEYGFRLP